MVIHNSRFDSNSHKDLYETYYNFGGEKGTIYTGFREYFFSSVLCRFWLIVDGDISFHNQKGSGRLLDVGCNEGRGLSIYQKNGFEAEGLELNEQAAAYSTSALTFGSISRSVTAISYLGFEGSSKFLVMCPMDDYFEYLCKIV